MNGQDLVYTVGSTGVFGVQIPSDVGTNLSSSNGTQQYTFQIDQKYVASPIYAGTDFGWVSKLPAMVRQYCEIPSCATTYDQKWSHRNASGRLVDSTFVPRVHRLHSKSAQL